MKKYLLISLIAFTLFSCSNDNGNPSSTNDLEENVLKITTLPISNLTPYSASSSVDITTTKEGIKFSSLERGICWSTTPNPTIALKSANDKNGEKVTPNKYAIVDLKNLLPNTKYYIKSYVKGLEININGEIKKYDLLYGDEINFTTHNPNNLSIGQEYGGGIIAYILKPTDINYVSGETHGLVMRNDASTATWGCPSMQISANSDGMVGAGITNTKKIFDNCKIGSAASKCYVMVVNNYNDWYLPSTHELQLIKTNLYLKDIGDYRASCYWTSTESSAFEGVTIGFNKNGAGCTGNKDTSMGIIPVRLF